MAASKFFSFFEMPNDNRVNTVSSGFGSSNCAARLLSTPALLAPSTPVIGSTPDGFDSSGLARRCHPGRAG